MSDEHDTAVEIPEGHGETLDRREVEMCGNLIEEQECRRVEDDERERQSNALSTGEALRRNTRNVRYQDVRRDEMR